MLEIKDLYKSYKTKTLSQQVLKGINLKINTGEFIVVMGKSGSGKTTLLNCIAGLLKFDSGQILLKNEDISKLSQAKMVELRQKKLGFVFQDFMLIDGLNMKENIDLPQILSNKEIDQINDRTEVLLSTFEISEIKDKYSTEISGGEKQRVAIARALANSPELILADEPTGNLDSKTSQIIIDTFEKVKEIFNTTIFMVTHDSFVASHADRVIILKDGIIVEELIRESQPKEFINLLLNKLKEVNGD